VKRFFERLIGHKHHVAVDFAKGTLILETTLAGLMVVASVVVIYLQT